MARGWKYWKCKLNLSHNWGQVSTEDGGHYVACLDCGKEKLHLSDYEGR
jgi:hypothetical protein